MEKAERVVRDVGRRIRELRVNRRWTQENAAERLGIALRNYQNIERGKRNLTLGTMVRVARVLGVRVINLLEEPATRTIPRGRPRKQV